MPLAGRRVFFAAITELAMFATALSRYWWLTVARGILWVLFGVLALTRPGISLLAMALVCGSFVFVDGLLNVVHGFSEREDVDHRWIWLLIGLAGMAIGVLALANPLMTTLVLLFYIAIWAIVTGVLEIVAAVRLRKEIRGE